MNYRKFGNKDFKISEVVFGAGAVGGLIIRENPETRQHRRHPGWDQREFLRSGENQPRQVTKLEEPGGIKGGSCRGEVPL